jgi:pimeloyl-ACP methyl ester carboxylesterase
MLRTYLLTPPNRKVEQLTYRTQPEKYKGEAETPHFHFLQKTGIPIWPYRIGEQYTSHITVLFSHGNNYDVPKLQPFVANLFATIVEVCKVCITLILWDYPGFSFSPYATKDFVLMEDHVKTLAYELTGGVLCAEFGLEESPLYVMGHSIGASLQTSLSTDHNLIGKIKGYFCIAPFYSMKDMSKNYFFGTLYFDAFCSEYNYFCNFEQNMKNRVDPESKILVVLCLNDMVTTSGSWARAKFTDLLQEPESVIMIDGQHNSPVTDGKCHQTIAVIFKTFLIESGIIPPEMI